MSEELQAHEANVLFLKRAAVVALEVISEALLLGLVLGARSFAVLAVGSLPIVVVLFLHGYYVTRPILGLLWSRANNQLYGMFAALLFVAHMGIAYGRLRANMRQLSSAQVVTFFLAGAAIVFSCALFGHGLLNRKARGALEQTAN